VYLTSTVKFNLVKFHSGINTQTLRSAISINRLGHTVVGWHLHERYTQTENAL